MEAERSPTAARDVRIVPFAGSARGREREREMEIPSLREIAFFAQNNDG